MSVFISYSRTDEVVVKQLVRGLEAAHFEPWADVALQGGDAWWETILDRIEAASAFLYAVSDASLQSTPCRSEHHYARGIGVPVLPIQVGKCSGVRDNEVFEIQAVTYDPGDSTSAFAVIAAVASTANKPRKPTRAPVRRPPIPFAYLIRLGRQIDSAELAPDEQLAAIDQLRRALDDESESTVQADICKMLRRLEKKKWATVKAAEEARRVLDAHEASSLVRPPDTAGRPRPAWYPDPTGRHNWRWFENGWTPWVSVRGEVVRDPI